MPSGIRLVLAALALLASGCCQDVARTSTSVSTGADFVRALADVTVETLDLEDDITLRESDFSGYSLPLVLTRNVTIGGRSGRWRVLDMSFLQNKLRSGNGTTVMVQHTVLYRFNKASAQAPGVDLYAPMPSGQAAILAMLHGAIITAYCLPASLAGAIAVAYQRPAYLPGVNDFEATAPVPAGANCVNDTAAPPLERCWAHVGRHLDFSGAAAYVDSVGKSVPNGYVSHLVDVLVLCEHVVTEECVTQYGPLGCVAVTVAAAEEAMAGGVDPIVTGVGSTGAAVPPPPPPVAAGAGTAGAGVDATTAAGGAAGNQGSALAAGVGAAVGGAVLLAVVAAGVFFVVRRRRTRAAAAVAGAVATADSKSSDGDWKKLRQNDSECGGGGGAGAGGGGGGGGNYQRSPLGSDKLLQQQQQQLAGGGGGGGAECATGSFGGSGHDGDGGGGGRGGGGGGTDGAYDDDIVTATHTGESGLTGSLALQPRRLLSQGLAGPSRGHSQGHSHSHSHSHSLYPDYSGEHAAAAAAAAAAAEASAMLVTRCTPRRPDVEVGPDTADRVTLLPVVRGKGSFGKVYEGVYQGERVAVKVLTGLPEGDQAATAAARADAAARGGGGAAAAAAPKGPSADRLLFALGQEVEVLGRCRHPNVVRLLAACLHPPRYCLVMELMEGSLEGLINDSPACLLPLHTALQVSVDIARALEYLHPTIVHRDLKPANVLINGAGGDRPTAKLTDFGLSRLRHTVRSTAHPLAGTPAYIAPECYDVSNRTVTHQADMYSFGMLLYTLLSGQEPWRNFSLPAIAFKVASLRERPPLDQISERRCPPRLRALIRQCFEHDPRRRPAAAEVAKELAELEQQATARYREAACSSASNSAVTLSNVRTSTARSANNNTNDATLQLDTSHRPSPAGGPGLGPSPAGGPGLGTSPAGDPSGRRRRNGIAEDARENGGGGGGKAVGGNDDNGGGGKAVGGNDDSGGGGGAGGGGGQGRGEEGVDERDVTGRSITLGDSTLGSAELLLVKWGDPMCATAGPGVGLQPPAVQGGHYPHVAASGGGGRGGGGGEYGVVGGADSQHGFGVGMGLAMQMGTVEAGGGASSCGYGVGMKLGSGTEESRLSDSMVLEQLGVVMLAVAPTERPGGGASASGLLPAELGVGRGACARLKSPVAAAAATVAAAGAGKSRHPGSGKGGGSSVLLRRAAAAAAAAAGVRAPASVETVAVHLVVTAAPGGGDSSGGGGGRGYFSLETPPATAGAETLC